MDRGKTPDKDLPFRVSYTNGDVIKRFISMASAEEDAANRNKRALSLGSPARYIVIYYPDD